MLVIITENIWTSPPHNSITTNNCSKSTEGQVHTDQFSDLWEFTDIFYCPHLRNKQSIPLFFQYGRWSVWLRSSHSAHRSIRLQRKHFQITGQRLSAVDRPLDSELQSLHLSATGALRRAETYLTI